MTESEASGLEQRVRTLCVEREFQAAATEILRELGPHVVRVIHARFRDEADTDEVFSRFAESLWLGLPQFAFRCSVRAWAFTLARNAGNRYLEREVRKARRGIPLSQAAQLVADCEQMRTQTLAHLRTENRDRVTELRAQLGEDEQLLLTLRVDRQLDFAEIAVVTLGDPEASDERVAREAARLRKRFQLLKDKLRRLLQADRAPDSES